MKIIFRILVILVLLPIFLVALAIGFLKFSDLNKYKPQIENLVEKYAGISVKINGDLDLAVSLKPSLEISDLIIYKPQSEEKLLHAEKALAQISIMPLFHKEIVVDTVQLDNTDIYTDEKNSVKLNNLDISMDDYATPIKFSIDTDVSGINIIADGNLTSLQSLRNNSFNAVEIDGNAKAMGYTLQISADIENLRENLKAAGNYSLQYKSNKMEGDFTAEMLSPVPLINLSVKGKELKIADFTDAKYAANSNLFFASAHAAEYIPNTKIPYDYLRQLDAVVDFSFDKIKVNPQIVLSQTNGKINLKNGVFKANINKTIFMNNTISGSLEISSSKTRPYLRLNINGSGFNLDEFQMTGNKKISADYFHIISAANASSLITNTDIPYQYLQLVNADVDSNFKTIRINEDMLLNDVKLKTSLKSNILNLNINNVSAGAGIIKGNITLDGNQKTLSLNLTGNNIILQKFYKPLSGTNPQVLIKSGGNTSFDIVLQAAGSNSDQYLNSLNGQIIAYGDEAVMRVKSLDKLQNNILVQILQAIKINIVGDDLNLKCAVMRGDVKNGLVTFPKGIAIDATNFYLVANGTMNLKSDKINFELQPFSGKITDVNLSSILGNLIKITGTISSPKLTINQTETAKNVLGIIASGGAYNVGDLMLSADSSPCRTALKGTKYAEHFKENKPISGAISRGYTGTKDTINDIGKGIKQQTKDIKKQLKNLF